METVVETYKPPWWQVILVGRRPSRTLLRLVILVVLTLVVFRAVLLPIRVEGISMLPTYKNGGVNFVNRLAFVFREPQRGDVVGIRYAGHRVMLMKRVVALPGETIAFENGYLVINGQVMEEGYIKLPCNWDVPPETCGPNEYYVVGDNRSMAPIDHKQGRAPRSRIVGKVLL